MKRPLWSIVVLPLMAGCGNSTDTVDGPTPTPTASPTASPSPTPTGGLSGNYLVSSPAPQQVCASPQGDVTLTFNVPDVYLDVDVEGGTFTPEWGFVEGPSLSLPDPEHGTITGSDFVANYTYCDFNGAITTKHVATWTGTFNQDGSFDSVLHQALRNAAGNQLSTCGAGELDGTVTGDMMACTSPGVSWQIHGEPE